MSIGNHPPSWAERPLSEVVLVIQGQSPPGNTYNSDGDGLPFFQGKAEFGPITPTAIKWCTEPSKVAQSGDVLISVRAPVGPTNLANVECCIGRGLAALRPYNTIPPKFVLYYLRHTATMLERQATGTTFKAISGKQLQRHPIVVPPVQEQHRILEALESYFTRLDDAVTTLERVRRTLKRYRASVLNAAVEGRLVPIEAELARAEGRSYEPASVLMKSILAERRCRWEETELTKMKAKGKASSDDKWKAKYVEPVAPDTTDLPELPTGWCWASVDQLERGDRRSGYGVLVPGPDVPMGVPFVRVGDIGGGRIDGTQLKRIARNVADEFKKTYLQGGEVLLTLVGTIGRTAVVPATLAGANVARAVGVIPASDLVDPHWVEYWFRSPLTNDRIVGKAHEVARKTLNLEDVRAAPVAIPPRCEQNRIRETLADYESIIDAVVEATETSSRRCTRLRQSILRWAFEGRLVDQDPTDEPASRLLERIRTERAAASNVPAAATADGEKPVGQRRKATAKKS